MKAIDIEILEILSYANEPMSNLTVMIKIIGNRGIGETWRIKVEGFCLTNATVYNILDSWLFRKNLRLWLMPLFFSVTESLMYMRDNGLVDGKYQFTINDEGYKILKEAKNGNL